MNELGAASGSLPGLVLSAIGIIVGFVIWFYVNRASVRASEQIILLQQLLEEQKKQNALLRRLAESQPASSVSKNVQDDEQQDFIRLIPER